MMNGVLNITGKRQLMIDPRIVAEQNRTMKCMSQARKLGRVMGLDERVRNKCWFQYATVTWDQALQKVRLDYAIYDRDKNIFHGVAHSSDGEHFQTPEADMLQVIGQMLKPSVRITRDFAECQRMLKACWADGAVTMNGKLSQAHWQKAPATRHFLKTKSGQISAFDTKVRVLYDQQAVYVGFECPGKRKWDQNRASENYEKIENLEVIIDPTCSRKDSYYFAVGRYGQKSQDGPVASTAPPGGRHGFNWYIPNVRRSNEFWHVACDTNFWKTFVHARLATAVGDRGGLPRASLIERPAFS